MAINYKPEQKQVIETQNKNQLVSASAGSGKTTIMIQKIINLITIDKIDIKKILVLTYTKASAEEMKQKLVSAINEKVKTDKSLISQIDDVPLADISTIHSFFQKVIKKYFMVLGINPSFDIIDETAGIKLKEEAFLNAIKVFEEKTPQKLDELLTIYGNSRNLDTIKAIVFELNTFLLSVTNPQKWCDEIATKLYVEFDSNYAIDVLNKELFEVAQYYIGRFQIYRQRAINMEEQKFVLNLDKIIAGLNGINKDRKYFVSNCELWTTLPRTNFRANEDNKNLAESISATKELMAKYVKRVRELDVTDKETLEQRLQQMKPVVESICELTLIYQEEYSKIKAKQNLFDYDDLEKCMLKLIDMPKICDELRNNYEKIFVDEYQDANRIQEKIISSICKTNNRFMVGDVKQSIYGFRQAEPDIFLETMHNFERDKENSFVGYLNYNFRSHNKILNFVNIVFQQIMTEETSKINYSASSIFKWDDGVYLPVSEEKPLPQVEIDIIKRKKKEQKEQPTKIYSVLDESENQEEVSDAQLEALFIASKIDELLGRKIYVSKKKIEKSVEYRDITILLRSRGEYLDQFCAIVTSLGIPLYANTNKSLFNDGDTQLLLNFAKLAMNFHNDVALVSVMHSVLGGKFTFNELAKIRLSGEPKQTFWQCVESFKDDENLVLRINALKEEIENFAFDFKNFGGFKAYNNLLKKHNFYEYVLSKEDGIQKNEKIKKYVGNFLTNGYNLDLCGFLEFVDNNMEKILAPDYVGGENCVSITTIHSSKGLEYPIVIMGNTNQDFDGKPDSSALKLNQKYGLGVKYFDVENHWVKRSLPFEAIKKVNKDDDFAEKLRLLYVALTRPQNHLIIVGTQKKPFNVITSGFETVRKKSYMELLVGALKTEEVEKINCGECVQTDDYCVNVINEENIEFKNKGDKNVVSGVDEDCVKIFKDYFEKSAQQHSVVKTKAIDSVSALRKQFTDDDFDGEVQEVENKNNNMAQIGTLYHKILEEIDFDCVKSVEDVKSFLQEKFDVEKDNVEANKIFRAVELIKQFGAKRYLKEQKFAMMFDINNLDENLPNEEVLINGIIDLICLCEEKNVLIDYKFSSIENKQDIINEYKIQLKLYKEACKLSGVCAVDECFLLLINSGELVEIK